VLSTTLIKKRNAPEYLLIIIHRSNQNEEVTGIRNFERSITILVFVKGARTGKTDNS
jgi:hypothetical protein